MPISDTDYEAVRALAAEGRPIPAIVMAAIVRRLESADDLSAMEREPGTGGAGLTSWLPLSRV